MKKLTFAVALCLLALSLFAVVAPSTANANQNTNANQSNVIYQELKQFLDACPDRTNDRTDNQVENYIQDKFVACGIPQENVRLQSVGTFGSNKNVVATIDVANTTKTVVVGAHFDTVYDTCHAAGDNACGVVALWQIASNLVQNKDKLSFDVVFVAFTGEEDGLIGSSAYVETLSPVQLNDLVLMINIDTIATGDNLYLFCENQSTPLLNTMLNNSKNCATTLLAKPIGVATYPFLDMWGLGYWEMAQNSDHTSFRLNGVPTAFFFSGNYSSSYYGYVESSDKSKWVANTQLDTLQNLVVNSPNFADKVTTVVDTVCYTLTDQVSCQVVADAKDHLVPNFLQNKVFAIIVATLIVLLAILFVVMYGKKLKKQSVLGVAEATPKVEAKTTPDAEDIFKF